MQIPEGEYRVGTDDDYYVRTNVWSAPGCHGAACGAILHIKDGKFLENGTMKYTFGGEGDGDVRRILTDAFSRGYDGGISIEPHMNKVFHDPDANVNERLSYENYVEYGKRMMALVDDIRKTL